MRRLLLRVGTKVRPQISQRSSRQPRGSQGQNVQRTPRDHDAFSAAAVALNCSPHLRTTRSRQQLSGPPRFHTRPGKRWEP
jgi:hypothetical protein